MLEYALITWAGDQMVAYEPIYSETEGEAVSFACGMLSERSRGHARWLAKMGVRYILDHGHHPPEALIAGTRQTVGTWHLVDEGATTKLLWQPALKSNQAPG